MSETPPASLARLQRAARGAHELSEALWDSLHAELSQEPSALAPDLAQRLADVSSALALLTRARAQPSPQRPPEPPEPAHSDAGIEIRDTREEERSSDPSAWTGSIGRRLERYHEDRVPFAVLLIEVLDIERLARAESPQDLAGLTTQLERAIGMELRPADVFTHEALGRYWLVTPETDAPGARGLAERLARTVRLAAQHRGAALEVAIGIAVCPEDGQDAAALAAHADVGVYAARASGRSIAPVDDPAA